MTNNTNTQMTVEDKKAIEALNISYRFRQNMNKIRHHYGF